MPGPVYVLPDPVLAVLQYLRLRGELTGLLPAAHIGTVLPANPVYPYLLVSLAGGHMVSPATEESAVQLDALAVDVGSVSGKETASVIARTARAAMWAIRNDIVPAGVLSSSGEESGPQWFPDTIPTPPVARFVQRHAVVLHP